MLPPQSPQQGHQLWVLQPKRFFFSFWYQKIKRLQVWQSSSFASSANCSKQESGSKVFLSLYAQLYMSKQKILKREVDGGDPCETPLSTFVDLGLNLPLAQQVFNNVQKIVGAVQSMQLKNECLVPYDIECLFYVKKDGR